MGAGLSAQIRLRDDDDIQRLREPLMDSPFNMVIFAQ
jgi:hypothetical protein